MVREVEARENVHLVSGEAEKDEATVSYRDQKSDSKITSICLESQIFAVFRHLYV